MVAPVSQTIDAVWRIEAPRLIAGLTRLTRDVGLAEELAQDALVHALEQWPCDGVPDNPAAWLMAAAKHRAIDAMRRTQLIAYKHEGLVAEQLDAERPDLETRLDEDLGDDLLRLVFVSCHPALTVDARVALTLRLVGSLTTDEIARAFLVPEPTIAQRIVRAKKTLADARVPFEVPRGPALRERLAPVLSVIYLVFNEGYSATTGEDLMRLDLVRDALRLGRVLAGLLPHEPEVHGLLALMELQASRSKARVSATGEPVLLLEQNRGQWDALAIRRGLAALHKAQSMGGGRGPYALQAALAACHARARTADETDWERIVALYDVLLEETPSPVIELNRAVALGMARGAADALPLVEALEARRVLPGYHLLPTVKAELLTRLGRLPEARDAVLEAVELTQNQRERALLLARAERLQGSMR